MIIKVDKEGQQLLAEFSDLLLKALGLQAYNKVGQVLANAQLIIEEVKPTLEIKKGDNYEDKTSD